MKTLINRLTRGERLLTEEYRLLLEHEDATPLHQLAREVTIQNFGHDIYVRGLIEVTNCCHNDCYYCGIRSSNREVKRYHLSIEQILECCQSGYKTGIRTFVLQGGESQPTNIEWLEKAVKLIRKEFESCAITLSLGEMPTSYYQRLFTAGANRYLLRHEAANIELYKKIHPPQMSHSNRLRCLRDLKEIGFQTGTGMMIGAPYQTIDNIIEDIEFIADIIPEMVGIGVFIPHHQTPFSTMPSGSLELALRVISIVRLFSPRALIPATTALATISPNGRQQAILSGANVVMPNLSPKDLRKDYELYDNKAISGGEASEGLALLAEEFGAIGYKLSFDRGDYKEIEYV